MKKEQLKRIFEFLEEKEGYKTPFLWKHMNNIPLTEEDLNIEGDLELYEVDINSLPEGLKIGRDLVLTFTKITSLPKGLKVGGDLYIYGTSINEIEDKELRDMIKPGFIKGEIIR